MVDQLMEITGVKPLQAHPFNVSAYIYRSFNTQKTLFLVDIQLFKFITLFENCEYLGKIENREWRVENGKPISLDMTSSMVFFCIMQYQIKLFYG